MMYAGKTGCNGSAIKQSDPAYLTADCCPDSTQLDQSLIDSNKQRGHTSMIDSKLVQRSEQREFGRLPRKEHFCATKLER